MGRWTRDVTLPPGDCAMTSKSLQFIYFFLAIAGAVLTWWNNIGWAQEIGFENFTVQAFWFEAFSSYVGGSLAWDIIVAGTVGLVLVVAECRRLKMSYWWIPAYWVLSNFIAAAFALPLFLLFRERALERIRPE
jgi:hypothetical protein